ncbi:SGNH/GDSL hydrolase family protein [Allokutzneria albata]|uniref:GDSL-like Lipase/Acylhydrolase family protein n=1 Tax=Allokutzneria albata TaxID=211114 RepID=A0A1H0BKY7_ALLAB|nr:SGNH/GDSL hydrolase family protein [Allokutzneria albata]SDN46339.1 GDSL-like Lipase/Acylhydrolase family protein [Allokutzneria albata]
MAVSALLRRVFVLLIATTTTALAAPVPAGAAGAAGAFQKYVALGDSFTAGPFIPGQRMDPIGCLRSDRNYPSLLAKQLAPAKFADVSCSGAVIDDMTAPQKVLLGENPPQLGSLTPDTDLVTVSVSGNDVGFVPVLATCALASVRDPFGHPCKDEHTVGGTDKLVQRIEQTAPRMGALLATIKQKAPKAKVLVVGYLRLLPPVNGCWPLVPIARGDVAYLDGLQQRLNGMLAAQATSAGVGYVDTYAPSIGRDVCQLPGTKWVEGLVPTAPAAPVHPNAAGMTAVAALVGKALTSISS